MDVFNPVTGEVVGRVPRHTADDVIAAVRRARAAQPAWAARPFRERARVYTRFHDLILDRQAELFDVIQSESGKSRRDAFVELFAVASEARYYTSHGGRFLRPRRVKSGIPLRDRSMVVYQPVGVVGIISPWNFPFILSMCDAIPALLAGNGVIIKPSSQTPLTALWGYRLLVECGMPEDLMQIVTGPAAELANALVDHVDFLMFTGSTDVGRKMAVRAARRLIPFSMELGGKNAAIVLPDADLKHAARVIIEGTFNNTGQMCIAFERAFVHEAIYGPFVEELVRQVGTLRLGTDRNFNCDVGSLVSREQLDTVQSYVQDAVSKGATVLAGGKARPDLGPYFYEPTLLTDVTAGMMLHAEETFGPVLAIYRVASEEEAIRLANDSRYGLHAAVLCGNRRHGEQVARRLQSGSVCVNDSYMNWAVMDGPMGGFKESGIGRRHGPEGIRKFCEPQIIITNRTSWQISSYETALAINARLARILTLLLRLWRHVPFVR